MNMPQETPINEQAKDRATLTSRELRRQRMRRIALVSSLFVGLPTLVAIVYYGFIASPQYDSIAVVTVEGEAVEAAGSKRPRDLDLVRQHMLSRAALDQLDREHGLAAHYQDGGADWWSRLDGDAGADELHDYFRDKVHIPHEPSAAALTVRVRAFSPEKAQELAAALIGSATGFLQEMSAKASRDLMAPADQAVADARARLVRARAAIAPQPAASGEAELEQELAREQLAAALRGLEEARVEAARRQRHLVVVAAPSLPDRPSEPRPLWSISTVFLTTAALLGVAWLLLAAVREHSRF